MLKIQRFVQPTQIAINKAHIYLGGLGLDAMLRYLAPLTQRLGHAYYVPCLDIVLPVASYSRRVLDLKVPTIYRRDQFRKFKA